MEKNLVQERRFMTSWLGTVSPQAAFQTRVWVRSSGHDYVFLEGGGIGMMVV